MPLSFTVLILVPGKKHFNLEEGENTRQFPELLDLIKKEIYQIGFNKEDQNKQA